MEAEFDSKSAKCTIKKPLRLVEVEAKSWTKAIFGTVFGIILVSLGILIGFVIAYFMLANNSSQESTEIFEDPKKGKVSQKILYPCYYWMI